MPCDLHTHSYYSDGTYSPSELIDEAIERGLSAIALTDHNTADGLSEFLSYAEDKPIIAVPGSELSCEFDTGARIAELHMLALFVPPSAYALISERNRDMMRRKHDAYLALEAALSADGIIFDYEALVARNKGLPNRANIAEELVRLGYASSIKETFSGLLKSGGKYYTPPHYPDAYETIDFIKSIDAIPVLAHPFLNLGEEELCAFLPDAISRGLSGMETVYSKFDEETSLRASRIAAEFGIAESGGSDFHGSRKPDISLGIGRGELRVPDSFLEKLIKLKEKTI